VKSCGVTEFAFSRSLRKDRYRLVYYEKDMFREEYPDGFGELYDLSEDPWEMHNLYFELSSQVIVADLKEELLQFLLRTTRPVNALGANPVHSPQNRTRFDGTTDADGKIDPRVLKISGKKNYR
jgi:arylsulfatase A-like enzyme